MRPAMLLTLALVPILSRSVASAEVTEFTEKAEWEAAAGEFTTIDFTGFPNGTFLTNQFEDLGVLFTDGADVIRYSPVAFPNDDWGLDGNEFIQLEFSQPMTSIAMDFPGAIVFRLFSEGTQIYESSMFGGVGTGLFGGLVSTEAFDGVIVIDPADDDVNADDLHFGPPIPAPGALALAGVVLFPARRRRGAEVAGPDNRRSPRVAASRLCALAERAGVCDAA
jgi:hypothetical protein